MPRDIIETQTYTAQEVGSILTETLIDAENNTIDALIEKMINGDQGRNRSRYKSAIEFLKSEKIRLAFEAKRAGIEIPETDVLRNLGDPTQPSGEAFNWEAPSIKFLRVFLPCLGFMAIVAWAVNVWAS